MAECKDWENDLDCVKSVELLLKRGASYDAVSSFINSWGYQGYMGDYTKYSPKLPSGSVTLSKQSLIWLASDWHIGKEVLPRTLGPAFAYNSEIMMGYVGQMCAEILEQVHLLRLMNKQVDTLYMVLAGDIIEGSTMRTGQRNRIEFTVGDQLRLGKHIVSKSLNRLCPAIKKIVLICDTGNHGRIGFHLDDDNNVDNHEMRLFDSLNDIFLGNSDITVVPSESEYSLFKIYNTVVESQHGHRIRGGGGRSSINAIMNYLDNHTRMIVQREVDLYLLGHFHQSIMHSWGPNKRIIVNSSLDGGDDYTCKSLGKAAGTGQWLITVDSQRGPWLYQELLAGQRNRQIGQPVVY